MVSQIPWPVAVVLKGNEEEKTIYGCTITSLCSVSISDTAIMSFVLREGSLTGNNLKSNSFCKVFIISAKGKELAEIFSITQKKLEFFNQNNYDLKKISDKLTLRSNLVFEAKCISKKEIDRSVIYFIEVLDAKLVSKYCNLMYFNRHFKKFKSSKFWFKQ